MRMTQYIGLTQEAKDFLQSMKATKIDEERYTLDMFDEEVPLGTWEYKSSCCPGMYVTAREVVQCTHWSSGPMIFCQLELESPVGVDVGDDNFSWSEYDIRQEIE